MLHRSVGHFDSGRLVRYYSQTLVAHCQGRACHQRPQQATTKETAAALSAAAI